MVLTKEIPLRPFDVSSVIRQKVESQNGCFKKTKHAKFSKKTIISYALIRTHVLHILSEKRNICWKIEALMMIDHLDII